MSRCGAYSRNSVYLKNHYKATLKQLNLLESDQEGESEIEVE